MQRVRHHLGARHLCQTIEQETRASDAGIARLDVERDLETRAEPLEHPGSGFGQFVTTLEGEIEPQLRSLARDRCRRCCGGCDDDDQNPTHEQASSGPGSGELAAAHAPRGERGGRQQARCGDHEMDEGEARDVVSELARGQPEGERDEADEQAPAHQPVTRRRSSESRASVAATAA